LSSDICQFISIKLLDEVNLRKVQELHYSEEI